MYLSGTATAVGLSQSYSLVPKPGGFATLVTPMGTSIELTEDDEREIAKAALKETMHLQLTAGERRKEAFISSALGAAGYALGLGIVGFGVAALIRWVGGRKVDPILRRVS